MLGANARAEPNHQHVGILYGTIRQENNLLQWERREYPVVSSGHSLESLRVAELAILQPAPADETVVCT